MTEPTFDIQLIPLAQIVESPWNPRKHFDPVELALESGAVPAAQPAPAMSRAQPPRAVKRPTKGAVKRTKESKTSAEAEPSTRARLSPEQLAELKRCYTRGDNIEELAEAMGVSGAAIYYHAKKGQWARAGATASSRATPAPGAKAITPTQTATRTCESCYQRTTQEPCAHCGAAWKRS